MSKRLLVGFLTGLFLVGMAGMANATILFQEDFETNLDAWTGQSAGPHSGTIVADPIVGSNNVLSFSQLGSGGDIFTTATSFSTNSGMYNLSFDYLGLLQDGLGQVAGNLGGTVGFSYALPGTHTWLDGTSLNGGVQNDNLIDDNTWHSYSIDFTAIPNDPIHLMFEDFVGSGGIAGDAYFDNIVLTDAAPVPEPATVALLGIGLVGLAGAEVRRRRKKKADN